MPLKTPPSRGFLYGKVHTASDRERGHELMGNRYKRILVKLSGEALLGSTEFGIDPLVLKRIASEILEIRQSGVQVACVIGGGNIFRGQGLARAGMDRVTGDHMGMLATVMNALAMQDALESLGMHARVMSAIRINQVCEDYIRRRAVRHRDRRRPAAEGDQGQRRVLGRPDPQSESHALSAVDLRQGAVGQA